MHPWEGCAKSCAKQVAKRRDVQVSLWKSIAHLAWEVIHTKGILIRELADIVPVAICSGNHDNAGELISHDRRPSR